MSTLAGGGGSTLAGFAGGIGTNALFSFPQGVAVASNGDVIVADSVSVRKITTAGDHFGTYLTYCLFDVCVSIGVFLVAGQSTFGYADGAATAAQFAYPGAVAIDTMGNIFVADTSNSAVRMISLSGIATHLLYMFRYN